MPSSVSVSSSSAGAGVLATGWVELVGAVELWLDGAGEDASLVVVPDEPVVVCVPDVCVLEPAFVGVDFGGKSASNMRACQSCDWLTC